MSSAFEISFRYSYKEQMTDELSQRVVVLIIAHIKQTYQ